MWKLSALEVFLIQAIIYLVIWLVDDYVATILTLSFAGIFFSIYLLTKVVEWIEPSKVPKQYFRYMLASALAPTIVGIVFFSIYGIPDWVGL